MKKIIPAILLLLVFLQSSSMYGQDLFTSKDLSAIKVDNLSQSEITRIKTQLQVNNLTIEQIEPMAIAKGMSAGEFTKLKTRLGETAPNIVSDKTEEQLRTQEVIINNKVKDSLNAMVFGSEIFDNPTLNFEPNLKLATPLNYVLGPDDELQISIYGVQEFSANLPVSTEGTITMQYVGQVQVGGLTIEAATQKIRLAVSQIYSTIRSGQSKLSVSLSRIRTIRITLIGSKQPGNYSVSSLSTVYNALFLGGGPGRNGSYRNIELLRNNKVVTLVDIYKFLVNGDQSANVGLKDNDVIRIPAYTKRVKVEGMVKRPGIFEMKDGETFADLLSFTSGFSEVAYTASVNVIQKTSSEFRIKDMKSSEFDTYKPQSGDVFKVAEILNRYENRVEIAGAVFRPDTYSFYKGMRIADLIRQADGLKEDAYSKRAIIVRLKPDLTTEVVNIELSKALSGDASANLELKREDQLTVYSILDFKEEYNVTINGEIRKPGNYQYRANLTLNDLLVQAGGLTGAASKKVEIARIIKSEEIDERNPLKAQLFNLEIDVANNEQIKNFSLQPFDVVNIRKMGVYDKPQVVTTTGAVTYPGIYVLVNKKEKVYDVIKRAGGLTSVADVNGVKIKRPIQATQIEALEKVELNLDKENGVQTKLAKKLKEVKFATIPVDWNEIIKDSTDNSNITLVAGDEIEVTVRTESVKVEGSVLLTSEIPYEAGKGFKYYIDAVGGLDAKAWKKKAYVIYPNGKAAVANSFMFFRSYPKVTPGSHIVVPEKPDRSKASLGDIATIASVLVGMAGVVIAILR